MSLLDSLRSMFRILSLQHLEALSPCILAQSLGAMLTILLVLMSWLNAASFCGRCSTCSAYESRVVSVHVHRLTDVTSSLVTIPTSGVIALRPKLVVRYECGYCTCARAAYHRCQGLMPSSLDCPWSFPKVFQIWLPHCHAQGQWQKHTISRFAHRYNCFASSRHLLREACP